MAAPCSDSQALPRDPTISARVLRELLAAVERAGVPQHRFLQAAKLDGRRLDLADGRILRSEVFGFCEVALDLTQDPALGIHWAEWNTANTFDLVSHLLAYATTLREAFNALFEFGELLTDQLNIKLIERDDEVEVHGGIVLGESLRIRRLSAEMGMVGLFRMLQLFSSHAKFKYVSFDYPAPSYRAEYTRLFGGIERFDHSFTGIVFDRALMDAPSPHRDHDLQITLRELAERRMSGLKRREPYVTRVRRLLLDERSPHRVSMKTVARRLEVSVRSLHRRLADEGKSYVSIANEASGVIAKRLIAEQGRTIQETAFAMGFSDVSSFHRAFKRWTGTTPTKFRLHG